MLLLLLLLGCVCAVCAECTGCVVSLSSGNARLTLCNLPARGLSVNALAIINSSPSASPISWILSFPR